MGAHTKLTDSRRVLEAIRRIVQALRLSARGAEKLAGISGAQLFVLSKLSEESQLSLNELAERTLTHQSSVSVVVQRLVEQRLVRRSRALDDGRKLCVELTRRGRDTLSKAPGAAQEQLVNALHSLPHVERATLAGLLEKVVHTMGISDAVPKMFFEESAARKTKKVRSADRKA